MRVNIASFMLATLWLTQPAFGDACNGTVSAEEFQKLSSIRGAGNLSAAKDGEPQQVTVGSGYLPSGSISMFTMPSLGSSNGAEAPELTYRAFSMPTDDLTGEAKKLLVIAVTKTDMDTQIAVSMPRDSRGRKLIERTSFLLVGCKKGADGSGVLSDDGEPEQTAVITHKITLPWSGAVWAVATVLVILLVVGGYAFKRRNDLGASWNGFGRSILYTFSNFRQQVSLSLVQLFIFTAAVAVMVAWHFGRTWQLTNLSKDVLFLLGISAAGATAGAWADISKNRLKWENWLWLKERGAFQEDLKNIPLNLGQLVTTRGEFDLYRFQALLFTLLVAPAFILSSLYSLDTAAIPEGILSVLGLSQVTYLVGKFADAPTVSDFDNSLTETITSVKAGNRLTDSGFARLKTEFREAMGIDWADETKVAAIRGDDGAGDLAKEALDELLRQKTAFGTAFTAATDQAKRTSAVSFRDASDTSDLEAQKADRMRVAARLSDEAVKWATSARDAARRSSAELAKALAVLV